MSVRLLFVFLSVSLAMDQRPGDSFLRLTCRRVPIVGRPTTACLDYFKRLDASKSKQSDFKSLDASSSKPNILKNVSVTIIPETTQEVAAKLGSWANALIGLASSFCTFYGFAVTYLHFRKGCSCVQALSLGLSKGHDRQSEDLEAPSLPVHQSSRNIRTSSM